MSWIYGIFGMVLTGFSFDYHGHVAPGMRPYEAVVGAVLMVTAMILTHLDKQALNAERGRTE